MRIVSLLPSLTELVCALGRGDDLVGVTHECDFPPGVERLPHLTRSRIPAAATSAAIDAMVRDQAGSLYELDEAGWRR
jgi:iron complex transport system substrate-binding protein